MKNKKALAAAVLAAVTMSVAAPAFAATANDIQFNGEARLQWINQDNAQDDTNYRLRLVVTKEIDPNLSLKARFAVQNHIGAGATSSDTSKVDQVSLTYKFMDGKTTAIVGKDDVIFANGFVLDCNMEAAQIATKAGNVDMKVFAGRSDYRALDQDVAGFSLQTKLADTGLGLNYLKEERNSKVWSVNANGTINKVALEAEYAQDSVPSTKNKAYMAKATVGTAEKKGDLATSLMYYKVEENTNIAYTTYVLPAYSDIKALRVAADYKLSNNTTLTLEHNIGETISTGADNNMTLLQLTAKF